MKKGQEIEITLEKFADRGKSLARINGYVVFVAGAVPGDRVLARIRRRKKRFAEAYIVELITPSPLRVQPRCEYFGTCGGCKWQHVDYAAQLEAKRQSVIDALSHAGGFSEVEVRPTCGSEQIFHYRNKMEYSFSASRWLTSEEIATGKSFDTDFALGMHAPGRFDRVIDLKACYLPPPVSIRVVNKFRDYAKSLGWTCWNVRTHEGYLRHLVIRTGEHTGEVMVNVVTNGFDEEAFNGLSRFFQTHFPEVTTLINTIHTGVSQVAIGEEKYIAYGEGVIRDKIGGYTFEISPQAFFQTNTRQAERLYEFAREFSEPSSEDLVYDFYCGAGTISIFMAPHVKHVVGVELVPEAIKNANVNASSNGIQNCTFVDGDLKTLFTEEFVREHGRPHILIVDPPRAGMHEKVVEQIAKLRPERVVYVSCNPQTQARDLKLLSHIYSIECAQPVDLFPHTYHTENVVKLRMTSSSS